MRNEERLGSGLTPFQLLEVAGVNGWLMRLSRDGGVEFNPDIPNVENAAAEAFVHAVRTLWAEHADGRQCNECDHERTRGW